MAREEFGGIPRVSLAALESNVVTHQWETAVEKLSLALCKHRVCVLTLSEALRGDVVNALNLLTVLLSANAFDFLQRDEGDGIPPPLLHPLPGMARVDFRLGSAIYEKLPVEAQAFIAQAYGRFDVMARTVLAAICRSCHVRLRSDTFTSILDEAPLARGCLSSSVLRSICHGSKVGSQRRQATPWRAPCEVAGSSHKGMLTLLTYDEAVDSRRGPLSRLQVKGADGRWEDVPLAPGEMAVMLGHTASRATAGLLQPAVYRVVGEAMSGSGRKALEYHLLAKPDAVLNFHDALLEAGHQVPDKFTTPVLMKELMRQFDTVLTPLSRSASGPASSSAGSVEYATIAKDALQMRNRKRLSSLTMPASTEKSSPVTRSGKVRRTSGNLVSRSADAGTDQAGEEPPLETARVFITVDGAGKRTSHFMRIAVKNNVTGLETWMRLAPSTRCGRLFEVYCETMGLDLGSVAFMFNGQRLFGFDLPRHKGLSDDCLVIVCSVEPEVPDVLQEADDEPAQAASVADVTAAPPEQPAIQATSREMATECAQDNLACGHARRERVKAREQERAKQQAKPDGQAAVVTADLEARESLGDLKPSDHDAKEGSTDDDINESNCEKEGPRRALDMLQCNDTLDADDNKENQP